jgi:hypothetical protein
LLLAQQGLPAVPQVTQRLGVRLYVLEQARSGVEHWVLEIVDV